MVLEFQTVNPWSTEIFNSNFHSLEVVDRGSETQLQVNEFFCFFAKFMSQHTCIWKAYFTFNN